MLPVPRSVSQMIRSPGACGSTRPGGATNSNVSSPAVNRDRQIHEPGSPSCKVCVVDVINKDLRRTFPENPFFNHEGQAQLRKLLLAYAGLHEEVGYCQGMNFVAGFLLVSRMFLQESICFKF